MDTIAIDLSLKAVHSTKARDGDYSVTSPTEIKCEVIDPEEDSASKGICDKIVAELTENRNVKSEFNKEAAGDSMGGNEKTCVMIRDIKVEEEDMECGENCHEIGPSLSSCTETSIDTLEKPHAVFACSICPYSTKYAANLCRHMQRIHIEEQVHKCLHCSFSSKRKGSLKRHYQQNICGQRFACEQCEYKTSRHSDLKKHKLSHTNERPFTCSLCDYASRFSGDLKKHLITHTAERPFKCDLCDYACNRAGNLKKHMLVHTDDKPFHCSICDYACKDSEGLKKHVERHETSGSDEKYLCSICDYISRSATNLKRHMRIHTKNKPHHCTMCNYSCKRPGDLKKHVISRHGDADLLLKPEQQTTSSSTD